MDDQTWCPGAGTASVSDAKLEWLTNPAAAGGKGYLFNKLGYTASNTGDLRWCRRFDSGPRHSYPLAETARMPSS
jgi:hypothetical protein